MIDRRFIKTTRATNWRSALVGKRLLTWYGYRRRDEVHLRQEHFMSHRKMRIFWDEPHASLYHPLRLYSRYLRYFVSSGNNGSNGRD